MKYFYFDHNVIIELHKGTSLDLLETVENINARGFRIVFSPAHIEEIAALIMRYGGNVELAADLLCYIDNLTQSTAFLPLQILGLSQEEKDGIYISKEHPALTCKRVLRHYDWNIIAEKSQNGKIVNGRNNELKTGVSSKEINNSNIQLLIDEFKSKVYGLVLQYHAALTENGSYPCIPAPPKVDELSFEYLRKAWPLHELVVDKIFEFLEFKRYQTDKSSNITSSLHDTTHAIYAAHSDVFVSNDRRLRKRSEIAYAWLGVKTQVLSVNEFILNYKNK